MRRRQQDPCRPQTRRRRGRAEHRTTAAGTPLTIKGFAFSPKSLTVKVGTTVTATNLDSTPHTWTSGPASFDSGNLDQGKSYSFTFKTPGTFTYVCTYHKAMVGTVVVTS